MANEANRGAVRLGGSAMALRLISRHALASGYSQRNGSTPKRITMFFPFHATKDTLLMSRIARTDWIVAVVWLFVAFHGVAFSQDSQQCAADSLGDVWELSTRHLFDRPRAISNDDPGFYVHRYDNGRWCRAHVDQMVDLQGRLPIVYVHGNFMEFNNTRQRALIINEYLKTRAQRPYRLIFLSWPSQREPHPLQDVRENAMSAECQSLYLAWLLERMSDCPEVSLLGFSYGARCVTGGLHLASGGSIRGLQHTPNLVSQELQSRYHIGFVAPAVDRTWLAPWGKHRNATFNADGILCLYNPEDPVLRRFRLLDPATKPIAAGYEGFVGNSMIQQYDCSPCVGRTHDERTYYRECPHFVRVLDHLLWNESVGTCRVQ